ncbi:hypothetical protein ACFQMA_09310 [Halosimplex aquaticum]|uniref:Arc-like DNA binding domain-containing protein n=1 Tax=Halosimplex aquaticum TaxID=3026162 RepID=A0ABD5Y2R9_9EURY|nr:hypothetical protein [Halosimplex aquaticum]
MVTKITLYDDDSDRFEEIRERLDEAFPGSTPNNAEAVRMMMDMVDIEEQRPRA